MYWHLTIMRAMTMNQRAKLAISIGIPLIALASVVFFIPRLSFTPKLIAEGKPFSLSSVKAYWYDIVGKTAWICEDGSSNTNRKGKPIVCTSRESYREWLKFNNANDTHGLDSLLKSGRVIQIEPQTECLIVKIHYFSMGMATEYEVRILEGPHAGELVIVDHSMLCQR